MPKISELDAATSVSGTDLLVVVQSGVTKKAAVSLVSSGTGGALAGTCTLEDFDAMGDGVTNDQAAWDDAFTALGAGTYSTLLLGAKTYLLGSGGAQNVPAGCSIIGQGSASILKTATNASVIKVISSLGVTLANFRIEGNSGTAAQIGIEVGESGTATSCPVDLRISGVYCYQLGWGFRFIQNAIAHQGPTISDCVADDNAVGGFWTNVAEYTVFQNCSSVNHGGGAGAPIGVLMQSGNCVWEGGNITFNGVGVQFDDAGNGVHGIFSGTTINHNSLAIKVNGAGNLTAGEKFIGCHIYGGDIWLIDCIGFQFYGCTFGVADFIFQGSVGTVIDNCKFDAVVPAVFDNYSGSTSDTTWRNCSTIANGDVPAFVGQRTHLRYTFPSDADQTLTTQESTAEVLDIQAGVITAARTITSAKAPKQGTLLRVKNRTAQQVNFAWSTGASVAIASGGGSALVGSDGTDAVLL